MRPSAYAPSSMSFVLPSHPAQPMPVTSALPASGAIAPGRKWLGSTTALTGSGAGAGSADARRAALITTIEASTATIFGARADAPLVRGSVLMDPPPVPRGSGTIEQAVQT